jgi:hypothetical protein
LDIAQAGGGTTVLSQFQSDKHPDAPNSGWKPTFPVGWTAAGPIAMVPVGVGTQDAWWGGPLYVIDTSGKRGRQVGGADCDSTSITTAGLIACTTGQGVVSVRDSSGNVLWATQVDGTYALSLVLSPDAQAITDGNKVQTRAGGLVPMPQGFQVEGWLDNNTVVGRVSSANGVRGNLSWINLSAPGTMHDLGFKGDFVGTVG